ncbi:MAG TPA: thioredoxin domain-containing protein [Candidatus Saccharimonadales bacterium]|nr:thioredoxin domain-containing protein [Candidatus Saccharimonadales bacterium]
MTRRSTLALVPALAIVLTGSVPLMAAPPDTQKSTAAKSKSSSEPQGAPQVSLATISVDGVNDIDPTKAFGSKNAAVVMEIFSDFQCPACKQLFTQTTQRVMDNYVNNNKVYLVHRDFPLPMHAYSREAASYSRAAAHIGRCEVVEQALFQNQEKWEVNGDVKGTVAAVLSAADMKKVQALVDSKALEPLIEKDKQIGQLVPVNQTPTAIIRTKDGQSYPVVGFVSFDVLKTLLDQLAK